MLRSSYCALWLALAAATASPVAALDFTKHANDSPTENAISAKGRVEPEDAFRFQAYLSKLPDKKITSIYLESGGGSIQGALALGRQVNTAGVRAYAIDGQGCLSACVYVLIAGKDGETGKPYRVKGATTPVGMHHFTPNLTKTSFTRKEIQDIETRSNKVALDLTLYFEEMDADLELLAYGLKQSEIYNLKNDEALPLGLHIYDPASKETVLADKFRARVKR